MAMHLSRRAFTAALLSSAFGPSLIGRGFAQGRDVTVTATALREGLFMLQGAGGNIALSVGEDGVMMVDSQFEWVAEKLMAAIKERAGGRAPGAVFNTHWHGDHVGGNKAFAEAGARIIAHENVKKRVSSDQFISFFDRTTPALPEIARPTATFTDEIALPMNGHGAKAFHIPNAHTDGDGVVHFEDADAVHTGDLLFNGFYPYVDMDSGGNLSGLIGALEVVHERIGEGTKVVPGHGPLTDKAGIKRNIDVLSQVRDRIAGLKAQGLSEEAVIAEKPTAEWDAEWGSFFINGEQITKFAYRSV